MAVGERERRELQEALVGIIGPDPTDTLLGYLPPVGWADVATKRDLDAFGAEVRGEMRRLEGRIDRLEGRIDRLEGRIEGLEGRIEGLEGRTQGLVGALEAKMHHGFKVLLFWMVTLQFATLGVLLGVLSVWRR